MASRSIIVALVAGAALAIGVVVALRQQGTDELQAAFVLPTPEALPDFSLLDQSRKPFGPESFRGQWDVVFFGFTHCPDICPVTLQSLSVARRELQESGQRPLPRIVLVSVDPERDTPELMAQYVDYFGDENVGISGELDEIRKLAQSLYVYFDKVPLDGDDYTVDHSPAVLVIDPDGNYRAGFAGSQTADVYASRSCAPDGAALMRRTAHRRRTVPGGLRRQRRAAHGRRCRADRRQCPATACVQAI